MFKRRKPLSYAQMWTEMFYPRSGWKRASKYVLHRLRRLPDKPHRVARGWAAGIFVSFTPFFGFHLMGAALIAWIGLDAVSSVPPDSRDPVTMMSCVGSSSTAVWAIAPLAISADETSAVEHRYAKFIISPPRAPSRLRLCAANAVAFSALVENFVNPF